MFVLSVRQSFSLSRSSAWLHCGKTAEWIKRMCGVNTLGGPMNIVLDSRPYPLHRRRRRVGKFFLPIVDPLHISRLVKLETLIFCASRRLGILTKTVQNRSYGGRGGVMWFSSKFCDVPHISGVAEAGHSDTCSMCYAFNVVFAKLLWPFVAV